MSKSFTSSLGAHGDTFYIIAKGSVVITKRDEETGEDIILREMVEGNYFGEMALLSADDLRTASVVCKSSVRCYTLDREPFIKLIGNVVEKDWNNPNESDADDDLASSHKNLSQTQYKLQDMELITTIGVGAFGRVEVRYQSC